MNFCVFAHRAIVKNERRCKPLAAELEMNNGNGIQEMGDFSSFTLLFPFIHMQGVGSKIDPALMISSLMVFCQKSNLDIGLDH